MKMGLIGLIATQYLNLSKSCFCCILLATVLCSTMFCYYVCFSVLCCAVHCDDAFKCLPASLPAFFVAALSLLCVINCVSKSK